MLWKQNAKTESAFTPLVSLNDSDTKVQICMQIFKIILSSLKYFFT